MANKKLEGHEVAALLSGSRNTSVKADPTEPRNTDTWFKLNAIIRESGCENLQCVDTRPRTDRGVNVVADVRGTFMCRFCYLDGWLSPNKENSSA